MTDGEAFQAMQRLGLNLHAPARKGDPWMARTNGGAFDRAYRFGHGATPQEAVAAAASCRPAPVVPPTDDELLEDLFGA